MLRHRHVYITTDKFGILQPESWVINGDAYPGEPVGTTIDNVKISEREACDTVNKIITDLGINNLGIAKTEKARIIKDYTSEIVSQGWLVTLTRNDGDSTPVNLISRQLVGLLDFGSEEYVERWWPEIIKIYLDESGIRALIWNNPLEVVEVLNDNVSLMQFDEIKERIRKYINFGYSKRVENGQVSGEKHVSINKITLTNLLIPIKDELDYQMLVPAWLIYYKYEEIEGFTFVFAVNAIDGSSIDLVMRKSVAN